MRWADTVDDAEFSTFEQSTLERRRNKAGGRLNESTSRLMGPFTSSIAEVARICIVGVAIEFDLR